MEVNIFEGVFDPTYLNLDPSKEGEWERYAEKVREIFSKCLELPKVDKGIRDMMAFKKYMQARWRGDKDPTRFLDGRWRSESDAKTGTTAEQKKQQ